MTRRDKTTQRQKREFAWQAFYRLRGRTNGRQRCRDYSNQITPRRRSASAVSRGQEAASPRSTPCRTAATVAFIRRKFRLSAASVFSVDTTPSNRTRRLKS